MTPSPQLKGVARTCLGPLHARAMETLRPGAIIHDPKSVELARCLQFDTTDADWPFYQLQIAVRTRIIDQVALGFMSDHPRGVVVNLGAGLDTRFHRLDNGTISWYEVDFPRVINLRRHFFKENERYHFVSGSVVRLKWMNGLRGDCAHLFIIEGLANYLEEDGARTIVTAICSCLSRAEIVMEALGRLYVKMNRSPLYKWGMSADTSPDLWDPKLQIVDSWCMFDHYPERWREFAWAAPLMAFRKNVEVIFYMRMEQKDRKPTPVF